jgi:hypothetical protein
MYDDIYQNKNIYHYTFNQTAINQRITTYNKYKHSRKQLPE